MDAKVDDWVVTPRRGKAVEINALWYNALRLMEQWADEHGRRRGASTGERAERVARSFNERFWYAERRLSLRRRRRRGRAGTTIRSAGRIRCFAISLPHPVLRATALGAGDATSCAIGC